MSVLVLGFEIQMELTAAFAQANLWVMEPLKAIQASTGAEQAPCSLSWLITLIIRKMALKISDSFFKSFQILGIVTNLEF